MTEDNKQNRPGHTTITSVSLTPTFRKYMELHNISPTEAMRKGIAIILHEKGDPTYDSELNQKRYKALKSLLKSQQADELISTMRELLRLISEVKSDKDDLVREETNENPTKS